MTYQAGIYALRTGRYQLSYRTPYSGKRKRHKYESYQEALEAQKAIESNFRPDVQREYAKAKIADLMHQHLAKCPQSRALQGRKLVVPLFLERFGQTELQNVTKIELEGWIYQMQRDRDISMRTIKHWVGNLNWFFDFLVDEGMLVVSPLRKIRLPSDRSIPHRRSRVVLSPEEIEAILNFAKETSPEYFYPLFLACAHTGARRGEILNLKWQDIDFQLGTLSFRRTKNGEDRTIHIPPQLLAIFKNLPRRSAFVFTCEEGLPIGTSQLHWRLMKFQRMFPGRRGWNWHAFRHSFAFNFLKGGGSMYALQAILGHRDISMTIGLYGQLKAVEVPNPSPYRF